MKTAVKIILFFIFIIPGFVVLIRYVNLNPLLGFITFGYIFLIIGIFGGAFDEDVIDKVKNRKASRHHRDQFGNQL